MSAYLMDTHALLWWAHDPDRLSEPARMAIADGANLVYFSPVSAFEIATKSRRGKLGFDTTLATDFASQLAAHGFRELPITSDHARRAGSYDSLHADPWDRMLAAQAQIEGLHLVTNDRQMETFGIKPYW